MNDLQPLLEQIGLNHHESTVYLALLQSGEQPASVLGRLTKIPRSTVRGTLEKLCERGVVRKLYKRSTQYYSCEKPESLLKHLHSRIAADHDHLSSLEKSMPHLKALWKRDSVIPKVKFFEGSSGVIEAFNHSLFVEDIKEILFFTSYQFIDNRLILKNDDDFYIPLRIKKGIRMRVLVGKTSHERKKYNDPKELRQRRSIPAKYALPGNIHIYGNFVVYFSVSEKEKMAVLIESRMMADTMRALFEFMWEECQ